MHSVLPARIADAALAEELAKGMALVEEQLLDMVRSRDAVLAYASALHAEALALLRAHPAMDAARDEVRNWAQTARAEISLLPGSSARNGFEALCEFVVDSIS